MRPADYTPASAENFVEGRAMDQPKSGLVAHLVLAMQFLLGGRTEAVALGPGTHRGEGLRVYRRIGFVFEAHFVLTRLGCQDIFDASRQCAVHLDWPVKGCWD